MADNKNDQAQEPSGQRLLREVGVVTIELGDDHNRNFVFNPTQAFLRGSWKKQNLTPDGHTQETAHFPDLPGMYVEIDCRQRLGRTYDPLASEQNRDLLEKAKQMHTVIFGRPAGPEKEQTKKDLSDTQAKTWLHHMRVLVDNDQARVVKGTLPIKEDIARLPGKTEIEQHNSSRNPRIRRYLEDAQPSESQLAA